MTESKTVTKDPICGMTVDAATAPHAEWNGETFYFCSDQCRLKFLSTPAGAQPEGKSGRIISFTTLPAEVRGSARAAVEKLRKS